VFSSDAGSVVVEGSLSVGTYAMTRLFPDLGRQNGAPDYEPDKLFAEAALTAGVSFTRRLSGSEFYGGVSAVGAQTFGVDPFDYRNQNSLRHERLYGGAVPAARKAKGCRSNVTSMKTFALAMPAAAFRQAR
jgi:hypothetical protein